MLSAKFFRSGAGFTTGADANDFVIFNTSTGGLFYDADGNGAGVSVQIAMLGIGLNLSGADFMAI